MCMRLDERVLYGRLKMATPEFHARFAGYLRVREDCRTGQGMLAKLGAIKADTR
jgi:hypothetical protein